ncbi:hypothetical protein Btru_027977 [Bulinus truncatus]|nr:hypothetical protein Btru_027977 [Bulinus truncatus]
MFTMSNFPGEDSIENLYELLKNAKTPLALDYNDSLFADSYSRREKVKFLPYEDTCWSIEDVKLAQIPNSDSTEKMIALNLFCHACFHPTKKKARRPHYVLLKNGLDTSLFKQEILNYGVCVIETKQTSTNGLLNNEASQLEDIVFYSCHECDLKASREMFYKCPKCDAVFYCDDICEKASYQKKHRLECRKFKSCMKFEAALGKVCFEYSKECTERTFTTQQLQKLLKDHDVFNKGLWKRESFLPCYNDIPYGDLYCSEKPYVLPLEGAVLETSPSKDLTFEEPLKDWEDYYNFRGFWFDSPVACLLHYPLTLYWVITSCLPKHDPEDFEHIQQSKVIEVHLLGAEREAEMFHPFLELARLLSPLDVRLHLFGDKLKQSRQHLCENLSFFTHPGFYHISRSMGNHPSPHLAIGFNAGLSAYPSFKETIEVLLKEKTPFYCTDYCYLSILHSSQALAKSNTGNIEDVEVNPFHSPFRMFASDSNLPRYSNAFIFHIKPSEVHSFVKSEDNENKVIKD